MGKVKKKGSRNKGPSPTGLMSSEEMEAKMENEQGASSLPLVSGTILGLTEKLQSTSAEERECACLTIAGMVTDEGVVLRFLEAGVVRMLGPLLVDDSQPVRQAALGALRNLSVDGSTEACDKMVSQDVMTPIVTLLKQYGSTWSPSKDEKEDTYKDIFLQAVHLLWNLCENNETAVRIFNQQELLLELLPCLQVDVYGLDVAVVVAQCLQTVTENNPDAVSHLNNESFVGSLQTTIQQPHSSCQHLTFRILAAGILYNITGGSLASASGAVVSGIFNLLGEAITMETKDAIATVTKELQTLGESAAGTGEGSSSTEDNDLADGVLRCQAVLEDIRDKLRCQQLALQLATNLCSSIGTDDDDAEWEDEECSDASDEVKEPDHMEDDGVAMDPLCLPSEVQTAVLQSRFAEQVLSLVEVADISSLKSHIKHKEGLLLLKSLVGVQNCALLCLNNMISTLDAEAVGGIQGLSIIWDKLAQMATATDVVDKLDLLEALTSAMRATIQKLAELNSTKFADASLQDLQFLTDLGLQHSSDQVRTNAVRITATIGCMLSRQAELHPAIKIVGGFLLEVCSKDTKVWVVAEALDAMFDLFGEDHLDPICRELDLVNKLKALTPVLKAKMQQQRKSLGDHLPVVQTARTNLSRFIKYKTTSQAK